MEVKLIAVTGYAEGDGPEELLERAGRLCYASRPGNAGRFLAARVRDGHLSLIEHASATFYIGGVSRACSHQLVRHRLCSFSQRSQRYVDEEGAQFVVPPSIEAHPEAAEVFGAFVEESRRAYARLRALGISKEDSRFVLPTAAATELIMTFNFREALHIFSLRIGPSAQWEIREVCRWMLDALYPVAPAVFGELRTDLRARYPQYWLPGSPA